MSEAPQTPQEAAPAPAVPATTPTIERANRLMSLKAHPGFLDVIYISQEMVNEAVKACMHYPGWDTQQMVVLKVRMQAAQEHHEALINKIREAIEAGVTEMRTSIATLPAKSPEEIIEQGDLVRQEVLTKFDEFDNRIPGSF